MNIQSSKNSQQLQRPLDPVSIETTCRPSEGNKKRGDDLNADFDVSDLDDLIPPPDVDEDNENQCPIGTHKVLQNRSRINRGHLINAPFVEKSALLDNLDVEEDSENSQQDSPSEGNVNLDRFLQSLKLSKDLCCTIRVKMMSQHSTKIQYKL